MCRDVLVFLFVVVLPPVQVKCANQVPPWHQSDWSTPVKPWLQLLKLDYVSDSITAATGCHYVECLDNQREELPSITEISPEAQQLFKLSLDARAKIRESLLIHDDVEVAARVSHQIQQSSMLHMETFAPDPFAVMTFLVLCVLWYVWRVERSVSRGKAIRRTWQEALTRAYLDPQMSYVDFEEDTGKVGKNESFTVWHMQGNGFEHECTSDDKFVVSINGPVRISTSVLTQESQRIVKFTTRKAGRYQIRVELAGEPVSGSPFTRWFEAEVIEPSKCKIPHKVYSTCVGDSSFIKVLTRDIYGNRSYTEESADFRLAILAQDLLNQPEYIPTVPEIVSQEGDFEGDVGCLLHFQVDNPGVLQCNVEYRQTKDDPFVRIAPTDALITIVALTQDEMLETDQNVLDGQNRYTATQLSPGQYQGKTVYIYIQPSQLFVRIFFIRVFAWKIHTMRVLPASEFLIYSGRSALQDASRDYAERSAEGNLWDASNEDSIFMLDDRCQPPIVLSSMKRNVIFATYSKFLKSRVGGSHSFEKKYEYFKTKMKLKSADCELQHPKMITVERANGLNLIRNVERAVSTLRNRDWRCAWHVRFVDEDGIDCGGVSRELFYMLGKTLFDPQIGLFCTLGDGGLVHPNQNFEPGITMETFEFAGRIVGKVLYEVAHDRTVTVPARFTRSFLASLLGLRSHFSFFETDDPEYFKRKVHYILEHSIEGLDLVFCEEIYDAHGKLVEKVDLKPKGSLIEVSNNNKLEYLNLLAQHRLENSVRQQVKHFVSGLNEIVPDELLSIFDENELELLICGHSDYDVTDLRESTELTGMNRTHPGFLEAVEWFWITVQNFTPDERRKLLQFVTGSGILPLGGFEALKPKWNISFTGNHNTLPTAHTCFNQFCLPSYDCMEDLHRALVTAITEGGEGFNLR